MFDPTKQRYIGDGLYASFDGYQFWLKTPQGMEVALEPEVVTAFKRFVKDTADHYETINAQKVKEAVAKALDQ